MNSAAKQTQSATGKTSNSADLRSKRSITADSKQLEVFFDGDCPLCKREIALLKHKADNDRIVFVDIAESDFKASEFGKQSDEFMRVIQGRIGGTQWVSGVEVFRQIYSRLGWNRLTSVSRWPVISQALAFGYRIFARLRYQAAVRRMNRKSCTTNCATTNGNTAGSQEGI
ncbi:MAG: DUF393 domain-containing protein [Planctomycetota bacterium]